jgi:hypothetical protein
MAGRTDAQRGERRKLEAELDKALAQTFPASDPFSVGQFTANEPPARPVDRRAPELPKAARTRRKRESRS